jgi:programmed cell death protein 5
MAREYDSQIEEALKQILEPEARERLATIKLVKPEKYDRVAMEIIRGAKAGRIRGQLDVVQLTKYLEKDEEKNKGCTKVVFSRRRGIDDSDEDDDNDDDL